MGYTSLMLETKKKIDIHSKKSKRSGFAGLAETFLLSFRTFSHFIFFLGILCIAVIVATISMTPSFFLYQHLAKLTQDLPLLFIAFSQAFSLALGYLMYGLTIIFVAPAFNKLNPFPVRPGTIAWHSLQTIPWVYHNSLVFLVRYTFLEFLTPSPINILFYRMMGMKIGKGVMINTTNISDPCLITIEDYVTVGGSAHILAHYGQKGILIIAPVFIGKSSVLGLKSTVMGDVVIGKNCSIGPHEVVMPKSRIPDNTRLPLSSSS